MRNEQLANGERYHVYNRGADKCLMYLDDSDKQKFIWNLQRYQYNRHAQQIVAISAFALMPNHFHIAIQQLQDSGISQFLHRVCNSYSQYFNKKYSRKGCLVSGRFQARHIHSEAYLLHLTRYIHRNPVAVVGEDALHTYPWSSYPTYLGKESSTIVTDGLIMDMFKDALEYQAFMDAWRPVEDTLLDSVAIDVVHLPEVPPPGGYHAGSTGK